MKDGGEIIHNFKMAFRQYLIRRLLTFINNKSSFYDTEKSINLTNALVWISAVWKNVSSASISK